MAGDSEKHSQRRRSRSPATRMRRPSSLRLSRHTTWMLSALLFLTCTTLLCLYLFSVDVSMTFSAAASSVRLMHPQRHALSAGAQPHIASLFPVAKPHLFDDWADENARSMHALLTCMQGGTCAQNQTKVVLLASFDFSMAVRGYVGGENIWANSVVEGLRTLGYTFLYSTTRHELVMQYKFFPSLVKLIFAHSGVMDACFRAEECIKGRNNPLGVPVWKMMSFEFWEKVYQPHPLGRAWTLSPIDYMNGRTYLGYSVESKCMAQPFIPHASRENVTHVLAKRLSYLTTNTYAWPDVHLNMPPPGINMSFVGAVYDDTKFSPELQRMHNSPQVPAGLRNIKAGILLPELFLPHLARMRLLLGVGMPVISPTPYDALCVGVPFLNPVLEWDSAAPDDRTRWRTQHDGLKHELEPRVYHVHLSPSSEERNRNFWAAVQRAATTPIKRYIPPEMGQAAVTSRLSQILEADWLSRATDFVEARQRTGGAALIYL